MIKPFLYLFQFGFVLVIITILSNKLDVLKSTAKSQETSTAQTIIYNQIPAFSFDQLDGTVYTHENLSECAAYLIVYFNSECNSWSCIKSSELINFKEKFCYGT